MPNYQVLRQSSLFYDLSKDDFDKLMSISEKISLEKDQYLIYEGTHGENFYFILKGEIVITRSGLMPGHEHIIAYLKKGNLVGEIALLDQKPRSASAKAFKRTELLSFSITKMKDLSKKSPRMNSVLWRIAENIIAHIRKSNDAFVEMSEKKLNEYKMRVGLGSFMINIIISLCLFAFFLAWIYHRQINIMASTMVSLPLTAVFLMVFFSIIKDSKLPLATFGLTTFGWRKAVFESVIFTAILCSIIMLIKWILIHLTPHYMGHSVFELNLNVHSRKYFPNLSYYETWWMMLLLYSLMVAPLQELIVRGGLQGPLQVFLTGKNTVLKAIFISNLIFATMHLFLGMMAALLSFFGGLYWGWLYARHHTLIGVIIAHAILGTWTLMIVGI